MNFFQNSVLNKHLKAQDAQLIKAAYAKFTAYFHNPEVQENIRNSKEEQYQGEFLIDLFVSILGYIKNPNPGFNLTTEYKNVKDSKKADGAILIFGAVKAVIELKGTETTDLTRIETQAFGYKNNQPECTYVITSNFEKLRFYIDNAIENIEFNLFTLTEKEFELLWLCLAFVNIEKNLPKRIKDESVSQEDVITKSLYNDYSLFKRELHQNLVALNPENDPLTLFKKSQKLLDRFLFLFFAEDRQLLPSNSVRLILDDWRDLQDKDVDIALYARFKKYFGYLNTGFKGKRYDVFAYNGGLFKTDELLDALKIDDELLYRHAMKLSTYDFVSEVDVNILGHIFENSLNELDEIKAQLEGQQVDKAKSKRKKDGVFYTPKYITKYIVDNTVGKLCTEKKAELELIEEEYTTDRKRTKKTIQPLFDKLTTYRNWLLQLTICDPACGSGAFLNQALDFLINEHKYIDELQAKLFGDAMVLSDFEKNILENNLFGVDINEESVEIAKLSLWLRTAQPNRKLNDLNNNIKCGNSLIDDPAVAGDKAFYWQNEFPSVFGKGGFDVVIGNPPWGATFSIPEKKYLIEKYLSKSGESESCVYFIEIAFLNLLSTNGILGFITPNTWFYLDKYEILRKTLIDFDLIEMIELEKNIFEDAPDIVPVIFSIQNSKSNNNSVRTFKLIKGAIPNDITQSQMYISNQIDKDNWKVLESLSFNLLLNKSTFSIINKIGNNQQLKAFYKVRYGIKTGNNLSNLSKNQIDAENWKFCLPSASTIKRYSITWEGDYLNFGAHLSGFSNNSFERPKLIIQYIRKISMERRLICALDADGKYYPLNNFSFIEAIDNEYSLTYLITLINSNLLNFYFKNCFIDYNIKPKYIERLPIPQIKKSAQTPLMEKAEMILSLNKELQVVSQKFQRTIQRKFNLEDLPGKLQNWYLLSYAEFINELAKKKVKLSLSEENDWEAFFLQEAKQALALKSEIDKTDKEIDRMVYELYGLTEEEIKIVEGAN